MTKQKPFDIKDRTFLFALDSLKLCKSISIKKPGIHFDKSTIQISHFCWSKYSGSSKCFLQKGFYIQAFYCAKGMQ